MLRSLALVSLLIPSLSFGWGFAGHRKLAAHLHDPLPDGSCLKAWVGQNQGKAFWDLATDPDLWRNTDSNEWSRHFLEVDRASPPASYPRDWAAALAQFGKYAYSNGQVPWRVEEFYGNLVGAFKAKSASSALSTLAHLSHYVTDSFSPLHDTTNSNPVLGATDTVGLHLRYESDMLEVTSNMDGIVALVPTYFGQVGRLAPKDTTFDAVLVGNPLVPGLVQTDVTSHGSLPALYSYSKDMTARRWGDAVTVTASLLASAYEEAGAPVFAGMPSGCTQVPLAPSLELKGYPLPARPPADAGSSTPDAGRPDGGFVSAQDPADLPPEGCEGCGTRRGLPSGPWVALLLVGWLLGRPARAR